MSTIQPSNADKMQGSRQTDLNRGLIASPPKKRARIHEPVSKSPSPSFVPLPTASTRTPSEQFNHASLGSSILKIDPVSTTASMSQIYHGYSYSSVGVSDHTRVHIGDNYYTVSM
jgi:hypothetical protein